MTKTKIDLPQMAVQHVKASSIDTHEQGRTDFDGLEDLIDSIKILKHVGDPTGIINPLVVTSQPEGRFLLHAGERRLRAARTIDKDSLVPVLVVDGDNTVLQEMITLAENMGRKQLTPQETLAQYGLLMQRTTKVWTDADVAKTLGCTAQTAKAMRQLNNLIPEWRERLSKGWNRPTLEHLAYISTLPEDSQRALGNADIRFDGANDKPISTKKLIEQITGLLSGNLSMVKWNLAQVNVWPNTVACNACPKRSCTPELSLFSEGKKADAKCLDPVCFTRKKLATTLLTIRAKNPDSIVKVTALGYSGHISPEQKIQADATVEALKQAGIDGATLTDRDAILHSKGGKGEVQAVYVNSALTNFMVGYEPHAGSKKEKGAKKVKPEMKTPAEVKETLAQKEEQLHGLRVNLVLEYFKTWLEKVEAKGLDILRLPNGQCPTTAGDGDTIIMAALLVQQARWSCRGFWDCTGALESLTTYIDGTNDVRRQLIKELAKSIIGGSKPSTGAHGVKIEAWVRALCNMFGYPWEEGWAKACEEKPEPKGWATVRAMLSKKEGTKQKKT